MKLSSIIALIAAAYASSRDSRLAFSRYGFLTLISEGRNGYVEGALVVGYTLKKNSGYFNDIDFPPRMVLMHLHNTLSDYDACRLRQVGWELREVPMIDVLIYIYHL
jgi:hypothetical protein